MSVNVNAQVKYTLPYGKVAGENDDNLMGTLVERTGTVLDVTADEGYAIVLTETVNGEPFEGPDDGGFAVSAPFAELTASAEFSQKQTI